MNTTMNTTAENAAQNTIDMATLSKLARIYGEELFPTDDELRSHLTFTSRERYLAWVAAWKTEYKALSARIRELKKTLRQSHEGRPVWQEMVNLMRSKAVARALLALRALGKRVSAEMREARREIPAP